MDLNNSIRTFPVIRLGILFLLVLVACNPLGPNKDEAELLEVIRTNTEYLEAEDVEGYMSTLHPGSPLFEQTRGTLVFMFENFDLDYSIEDTDVLSIDDDFATVRVVQTTRKVSGSEPFRNNRIIAVHTFMRDEQGDWKIAETAFQEIEYLDPSFQQADGELTE